VKERAAWRRWLERNHGTSGGVWVVLAKKGVPGLGYEEAVEEALCFGWIDAKANSLDERRYKQWLAPRKARGGWSASNKARIERLIAEGRMAPAGLAAIEAAKANGSWSQLDGSQALRVPRDLAAALRAHPHAKANFDAFPPSVRRSILAWIEAAKRPETRAKRIAETADLAERRITTWFPPPVRPLSTGRT
jgi:uncharacterized protein YdeI (YjbR/CyaY-like superfamily)